MASLQNSIRIHHKVSRWERKIHCEDYHLASQGLLSDDKRWSGGMDFSAPTQTNMGCEKMCSKAMSLIIIHHLGVDFPKCLTWWFLRFPFCANAVPQISHLNGFSPEKTFCGKIFPMMGKSSRWMSSLQYMFSSCEPNNKSSSWCWFPKMSDLMILKISFLCKRCPTDLTFEWFLSGMNSHMAF